MSDKAREKEGLQKCHCGAAQGFSHCCEPVISGSAIAETAEQLMRSRYSAFVVRDESYLLASWHPDTRPSRVRLDAEHHWLGLAIKATQAGCAADDSGTVEFVARFKVNGKGHRLHELSRFDKVAGRWYYLDGQHL